MKAFILALTLALGACSGTSNEQPNIVTSNDGNVFTDVVSGTFEGVFDTIQTPFRDLGFTKEEIPESLAAAANGPYSQPASKKCKAIMQEITALNEVLGEDKYDPEIILASSSNNTSYFAEGIQYASGMAIAKTGKIAALPFRGVVRRVSGAAKQEKASKEAHEAGEIRRAYLRGMADSPSLNCFKQNKKSPKVKQTSKDEV